MANGLEGLLGIGAHIAQRLTDAGFSGMNNQQQWKRNKLAIQGAEYENQIAPELFDLKKRAQSVDEGLLGDKRANTTYRGRELGLNEDKFGLDEREHLYKEGEEDRAVRGDQRQAAIKANAPEALFSDAFTRNPLTGQMGGNNALMNALRQAQTAFSKQAGKVSASRTAGREEVEKNYDRDKRLSEEAGQDIANNGISSSLARGEVDKRYPKGTLPPKRGLGVATEEAKGKRRQIALLDKAYSDMAKDPISAQLAASEALGPRPGGGEWTLMELTRKRKEISDNIVGMVQPKAASNTNWRALSPSPEFFHFKTKWKEQAKKVADAIAKEKGYTSYEDFQPEDEAKVAGFLKIIGLSDEEIEAAGYE